MTFLFSMKVILIGAFFCLFSLMQSGIQVNDDTPFLLSTIESITTEHTVYVPYFEEKPKLFPFLTTPGTIYPTAALTFLTGSTSIALVLINLIYYFVSLIFIFNIGRVLFKEETLALIATIFFAANYFIVRTGGVALSTDMGGWMLYIISVYYAIRFFYEKNETFALYAGIAIMTGIFFKESGAVGAVVLFLLVVFSSYNWRKKLSILFRSFSFLAINAVYHIWIYLVHDYSYFTRYLNVAEQYYVQRNLRNFITGIGSLFFIGWIPVALATYNYLREFIKKKNPFLMSNEFKVYVALGIASLSFFIYPAMEPRIYAIALPFLSLLAVRGLLMIGNKNILYATVSLYVVTNLFMPQIMHIL